MEITVGSRGSGHDRALDLSRDVTGRVGLKAKLRRAGRWEFYSETISLMLELTRREVTARNVAAAPDEPMQGPGHSP
jgi:hypothetical protein